MFLLFGDNYVKDGNSNLLVIKKGLPLRKFKKIRKKNTLKNFYRSLAELNLGRQISVYCTK